MKNGRIRELAEQLDPVATIGNWGRVEWADSVYPQLDDKMYAAIDLQKFAELIIRECISIAECTGYEGKVVASRIKFNFGVDNEEIIRQIDDLLDAEAAEEFKNWCKESDDGAE